MHHGIGSLENDKLHTGMLLCESCCLLLCFDQVPVDATRWMQWIKGTLLVCFVFCFVDAGYDVHGYSSFGG